MGLGYYSKCANNSGIEFKGEITKEKCMYKVANLIPLAKGNSKKYVETKESGFCFFENSYFVVGYAKPDRPNDIVIGIGLSEGDTLTFKPPWQVQKLTYGVSTAYILSLPGNIPVTLESFKKEGKQGVITWKVDKPSASSASDSGPLGIDDLLEYPPDGSDYQGPEA